MILKTAAISGMVIVFSGILLAEEQAYKIELKYLQNEVVKLKRSRQVETDSKFSVEYETAEGQPKTESFSTSNLTSKREFSDEIVDVDEHGMPVKVKREFVTVHTKTTWETEAGKQSAENDFEGNLEGKIAVISRKGDEKVIEGIKTEEINYCKQLDLGEMPEEFYKHLLPKNPLKIGESWNVEEKELDKAFEIIRLLAGDIQKPKAPINGNITGKLNGISEFNKRKCLELEFKGELDSEGEGDPESFFVFGDGQNDKVKGEASIAIKLKFSCTILYDIEQKLPVSAEWSAILKNTIETRMPEQKFEGEGMNFTSPASTTKNNITFSIELKENYIIELEQ